VCKFKQVIWSFTLPWTIDISFSLGPLGEHKYFCVCADMFLSTTASFLLWNSNSIMLVLCSRKMHFYHGILLISAIQMAPHSSSQALNLGVCWMPYSGRWSGTLNSQPLFSKLYILGVSLMLSGTQDLKLLFWVLELLLFFPREQGSGLSCWQLPLSLLWFYTTFSLFYNHHFSFHLATFSNLSPGLLWTVGPSNHVAFST
jgi:hypothetical protein